MSARYAWLSTAALLVAVSAAACAPARRASLGGECELNSDCDTPLVCRLAYCRKECATSADCAAGLSCVLDPDGLGACQRPAETSCTLATDCPEGLLCRFNECTNACETDRDCPGGTRCERAAEGLACIDRSERACTYDAECQPELSGERCLGGRCRRECFADRDCRNQFWCNAGVCYPPPRPGVRDAGADAASDAGVSDGGVFDASSDAALLDASAFDGGLDASALDGGLDASAFDGGVDGGTDAGAPVSTCFGGPLTNVTAFDVGPTHSCAVIGGAVPGVACWGTALVGSMLFGASTSEQCARRVAPLEGTTVVAIAAADSATCIVRGTRVECWGSDTYGQQGNGSTAAATAIPTPVSLVMANNIAGADGTFFTWGGGGGMRAWGRSNNGSIGDGSTVFADVQSPIMPSAWTTPSVVSGSLAETCAIVGGTLSCIGGRPGPTGPTITTATDVALGNDFGCALTPTDLRCWGANSFGTLGDGTTTTRASAAAVLGLPSLPVEIDAGESHVCARLADGEVWCWGFSSGFDPAIFPPAAVAVPQRVFSNAVEVHCGNGATCTRTTASGMQCIGLESSGFGYGGPVSTVPVDVLLR